MKQGHGTCSTFQSFYLRYHAHSMFIVKDFFIVKSFHSIDIVGQTGSNGDGKLHFFGQDYNFTCSLCAKISPMETSTCRYYIQACKSKSSPRKCLNSEQYQSSLSAQLPTPFQQPQLTTIKF